MQKISLWLRMHTEKRGKTEENLFQVKEVDRNINRKSWDDLRRLLKFLKCFDASQKIWKNTF